MSMSKSKVVAIMGSEKDLEFTKKAVGILEKFRIEHDIRVASAHKTPRKALEIIEEYEDRENLVYLTVAGRSNALSGFIDANTDFPVIACPPYSDKFAGSDIYSSLRMPTGVGPMVVLEPKNAALAAAKILALKDSEISERISSYREELKEKVRESDSEVG